MQNYQIKNYQLSDCINENNKLSEENCNLCIFDFENFSEVYQNYGVTDHVIEEYKISNGTRFESHDGFDFIMLNLPDAIALDEKPRKIGIIFKSNLLLFFSENPRYIIKIAQMTSQEEIKVSSPGKFLQIFFDKLTYDDREVLIAIEEEISGLEEEFIISIKNNLVDYLVSFRKKMLILKQYYEQLLEVSESIEENDNKLMAQEEIKYFKILTNRINRLFTNVLNLRDYGTQVREAYQAQLDINLNNVMKLFTVITSVFLPLTLIVGWFGMNLIMPEFKWIYGYPFVIVLCLLVASLTLFYFKKKKWF